MKKTLPLTCLFLWLISLNNISVASTSTSSTSMESPILARVVTASDYCFFLNAVATRSDPNFLYDDKMSSEPRTGAIARVGTPGSYEYFVIAGRENWPITFVNEDDQAVYMQWLQSSSQPEDYRLETIDYSLQSDSWLKSDASELQVVMAASPALSIATSLSTSTSHFNSCLEEASVAAGIIGLAAFGHELMIRHGGDALRVVTPEATLDDFEASAQDHPTASCLIVNERGIIQPYEVVNNGEENLITAQALKNALSAHYPSAVVEKIIDEELPKTGTIYKFRPALSVAKFHRISERVAQESAQQQASIENFFHQIAIQKLSVHDANFEKADQLWSQANEAWISRYKTRQELEVHQEVIDQLQQLLQQEETKLAKKILSNVILTRVGEGVQVLADQADSIDLSTFVAGINLPGIPAGGVLRALYDTVVLYQRKTEEIPRDVVQEFLQQTIKEHQEAEEKYEEIKSSAPQLTSAAQEAEKQAISRYARAAIEVATALKPPSEADAQDVWLRQLTESAKTNAHETNELAQKVHELAAKNPTQLRQIMSNAWIQKIRASDEVIAILHSHQEDDEVNLHSYRLITKHAAEKAKAKNQATQRELASALENKTKAERRLHQLNEEMEKLEDASRKLATAEIALPQKKQLREYDIPHAEKNLADAIDLWETTQQLAEIAERISTRSEREFVKAVDNMSEWLPRAIFRATARAHADREAFAIVWPDLLMPALLSAVGDKNSSPWLPFLKMIAAGIRSTFPWQGVIPGVFEEVGIFLPEVVEKKDIVSEEIQKPLLLGDHLERLGRSLFETSTEPNNEARSKVNEYITQQALQAVRLAEAGINVLNPNAQETARWDALEKMDQLEKKIDELQSQKKQSALPAYISDRSTMMSGITFNSSILSGTSSQERVKIDTELRNLKKEKKKFDDEWNSLVEHAEQGRKTASHQARSVEEASTYWKQIDRDAIEARNWARDVDRWKTRMGWEQAKQYDPEAAKAAKKKWSALADLHLSMTDGLSSEEPKDLKIELAAADLVAVTLRNSLFGKADERLLHEDEYDETVLTEWRTHCLTQCFESADSAYAAVNDAKKKFKPAKILQTLSEEADKLEEEARTKYAKQALEVALLAFRQNKSETVINIWRERVEQSIAEANHYDAAYKQLKNSAKTEDEKRKVNRAVAAATAEQAALERVKAEAEQLDRIEKRSKAALEIADQVAKLRIEHAVAEHAQRNDTAWEKLPNAWKAAYNKAVEMAGKNYEVISEQLLTKAYERVAEAENQFVMAHHDENALKTAHSFWGQEKELDEQIAAQDHISDDVLDVHYDDDSTSFLSEGRQSSDALSGYYDGENNTDLFSGLEFRNFQIEAARKNLLSAQAHLEGVNASMAARNWFADQGGLSSSQRIEETAHATAELWYKAIAQFQTTAKQFAQAAEMEAKQNRFFSYLWSKVGSHSQNIAEKYVEGAWSFSEGKKIEAEALHNEAEAAHETTDRLTQLAGHLHQEYIDNKAASGLSNLTLLLSLETQHVEKNLIIAQETALALDPSDTNFEPTWSRVIEQAEQAKEDWLQVLQIYHRVAEALPENDRPAWEADLSTAKYLVSVATMRPLLLQAEKAEQVTAAAISKARALTSIDPQFESTWAKAITEAPAALEAWKNFIQKQRELQSSIPSSEQADWNTRLNEALYNEALCTLLPDLLNAYKAEAMEPDSPEAEVAWNKALKAFDDLEPTLPENHRAAWKGDRLQFELARENEQKLKTAQQEKEAIEKAKYEAQEKAADIEAQVSKLASTAQEKQATVKAFSDVDHSCRRIDSFCKKAAACLLKTRESLDANNQEISNYWLKAAQKYQIAAEESLEEIRTLEEPEEKKLRRVAVLFADKAYSITERAAELLVKCAELWPKIQELKASGNEEAAQKYKVAVQEFTQSAQAYSEGKKGEAQNFKSAAEAIIQAAELLVKRAELWSKVQELRASGNEELAHCWLEVAQKYEVAAQEFTQSAQAREGEYGGNFRSAAKAIIQAAEWLAERAEIWPKMQEANILKNNELTTAWSAVAAQYQQAVRACTKKAQLHKEGKYTKAAWWEYVSDSSRNAAKALIDRTECIIKIQEFQPINNQELIDCWTNIDKQYERAVKLYRQSAEAYERESNYSTADQRNFYSGHGHKYEEDARNTKYAASALKPQAEYLLKAQEARIANNSELADCWSEAAQKQASGERTAADLLVMRAKYFPNLQEARRLGNEELARYWSEALEQYKKASSYREVSCYDSSKAADALVKRAEYHSKLQEAQEAQNKELIDCWSNAVQKYQLTAERYITASHARSEGMRDCETDREIYSRFASITENTAKTLAQYAESIMELQKLQLSKNSEALTHWAKVIQQYRIALEKCVEAERISDGYGRDYYIARFVSDASYSFMKSVHYSIKAKDAQYLDHQEAAFLWREASQKSQNAADINNQAAKEEATGTWSQGPPWSLAKTAEPIQKEADKLARSAQEQDEESRKK